MGKFKLQKDCYKSCQSKRVLGLVEMTCGLVHAIYSLPEWQAVKLTFFAPCNNTKHAAVDKPGSDQIGSALKLISELLSFNELQRLIGSDPVQVLLMPQTDMSCISKPGFLSNVKLLLEMPTHLFLLLSIFHVP